MSTENEMGDEVYQPDGDEVQDDTGLLEPEDTLIDRGASPETEGYSPPERPLGVDGWGTTAQEQHEGEPLEERLERERPEISDASEDNTSPDSTVSDDTIGDLPGGEGEPLDAEVGDERTGRLLAPDEGLQGDRESTLVGEDVGIDSASAPAEEAAVHTVADEGETDQE